VRRRIALISALLTLSAVALFPGSVLASEGYDYGVVHDYCGGTNGWTAFYKASIIASDTAGANKLTIDSSVQARDPGHPHWYRTSSWPRVSTTFTPDGTYHVLTLGRKTRGGVDVGVRIVFKLRAWDYGLLAWTQTLYSTVC
jgi:hypothetical protein